MVGEAFDEEMFRDIAGRGVKAFICDSTNVFSRHPGRSESQLPEPIGKLIADARGMVVATTFASNVARLKDAGRCGRGAGAVHLPSGPCDETDGDGGRGGGAF